VRTFKLGLVVTCQVNGSSPFNVPDMFPPVSRGPRPQCYPLGSHDCLSCVTTLCSGNADYDSRQPAKHKATYMRAPNSSAFDHVQKRQRLPTIQPAPTHTPSIHVHFLNPTSPPQLSITTSQPPAPTVGLDTAPVMNQPVPPSTDPIIDLTGEVEELGATYPTISKLLPELDKAMPALGVTRFKERLSAAGFGYVHQLMDTPVVCATLSDLEIPVGITEEIIKCTRRMTRRAAKKPAAIKNEDDGNHEH